jgi:quinol monooxygenase YgiN
MPIREREINASRRTFITRSLAAGVALTLPMAAGEAQHGRQPMVMTIRANTGVMTLINVFTVDPENQQRLVAVLKEGTEALMSKRAGYISVSIHVSKDGRRVINYSQWRSVKDIEAMRQHPDVGPYMKRVAGFGTFEAIACEVSYVHQGGDRSSVDQRSREGAW